MLRPTYSYDNNLNYSQNEKCFRQKVYTKSKHTFKFNNFFSPENCANCEIMWKDMAQPGRQQNTIKCGACVLHAG